MQKDNCNSNRSPMRCELIKLREQRELSIKALSELSNVPERVLTDIENGRAFEMKYLIQLYRFYKIPI